MDTTLRSRHKRAARVAPALLLGLSLLAACNTDRPVAPENTKASSVKTPSAYWSGAPGAIAFNIVDESQVAVTGWTSFWLIDSKNDSNDSNWPSMSRPLSSSTLQSRAWPGSGAPVRRKNGGTGQVKTPGARAGEMTGTATLTDWSVQQGGNDRRRHPVPEADRGHASCESRDGPTKYSTARTTMSLSP